MSLQLRPLASVAALLPACWLAGCAAVAAVSPAPAPASSLEGTAWQLERLASMSDDQPPQQPADAGHYTLEFAAGGRAVLRLDCNRANGSYQAATAPGGTPERPSGSLQFGPLATTRAACPPGSLAPRVARELPFVRSWVLENGRLHLALMADGGIQTWAPLARP